jgi:hypothetical protein
VEKLSIVNEVVSALEAPYGEPGFWILLGILVVLVLVIAAVVYQRIVINRSRTASKATQDFETTAADLRKRALEVKNQDEGLRKREVKLKERKQQQVLKRSQRALKGSVSHTMLLQRKHEDGGVNNSESGHQPGRQASIQ